VISGAHMYKQLYLVNIKISKTPRSYGTCNNLNKLTGT
jgi:hypothetical protein